MNSDIEWNGDQSNLAVVDKEGQAVAEPGDVGCFEQWAHLTIVPDALFAPVAWPRGNGQPTP